jgi:hypothetical protein
VDIWAAVGVFMWQWAAVVFLLAIGAVVGFGLGRASNNRDREFEAEQRRRKDRTASLESENNMLMAKNGELRKIIRTTRPLREAVGALAHNMEEFIAPSFVDEYWFKPPGNMHEISGALRWATEAAELWRIVGELSHAAKRNLEESCVIGLTHPSDLTEPVSSVLARTIKLSMERPEGVIGNLFERSAKDYEQLARWLEIVSVLGPYVYRDLFRVLVEAHRFREQPVRDEGKG